MNNTFFIWLLLLPVFAFGQKTDTTTYKNANGVFVEVKTTQEETAVGDTATLISKYVTLALNESSRLATDVAIVSKYGGDLTKLIRSGEALQKIIGKSPLDSISDFKTLFETGWNINMDSKSMALKFRQKDSGVTQWRSDTATQWRRAVWLHNSIRLYGFGGQTVDFWKVRKGRFVSLGYDITITEPGATVRSRSATGPPLNDQNDFETYPGGIILVNSAYWKYDSRKKAWVITSAPTTQPIILK